MSTLSLDELFDGVTFTQKFRIDKNLNIIHIRPWIYKEGTLADGDFRCQVYLDGTLVNEATINYTNINAAFTETYAHGFIRFDFDSLPLRLKDTELETEYELRFEMINHTTDMNNYLAIVRNWDLKIYTTYGDVVNGEGVNDMIEPAGLEFYEIKI